MFPSTVQPSMNSGDISQHCGFSFILFSFVIFWLLMEERLWRQMLLREEKSLKVWELQGRSHPLSKEGAGQRTRCGTNECMYGWDSSGFKVSMLRPAAETDCGSWRQLFCDLNFAFCGWRHSHISWFGNFLLCRPIRNIIQLSLNTECEQHEHLSAHVGQEFRWSVSSYPKQSLKKEIAVAL